MAEREWGFALKQKSSELVNRNKFLNSKLKLAPLGLTMKDSLVLKSYFNSSKSIFTDFEFVENLDPAKSDILVINADIPNASKKWVKLQEKIPTLKSIVISDSADNLKLLEQEKLEDSTAAFLLRPINARLLKSNLDYLSGETEEVMYHKDSLNVVQKAEPPLFVGLNKDPLNILIVDDSTQARNYIYFKILELVDEEVVVEFAENGDIALDKCQKKYYDLVFLDVEMPGKNGFEVCKILRSKSAKQRIVMLTSKSLSSDYKVGRESGSNHYLAKPPAEDEVKTILSLSMLKKKMLS